MNFFTKFRQERDQIRINLERSLSKRALFIGSTFSMEDVNLFFQFVILLAQESKFHFLKL